MQFEWSYLQRILPSCEEAFTPIWNTLYQYFWPAIFEGTISDHEKQLFSIPARLGGMGVRNPIESAKIAYTTSRAGTRNIVDAIKGKMEFSLPDHKMSDAMSNMHTTLQQQDEVILHSTLANSELNAKTRRAIQRAVEGKTSSWLTALHIAHHHFDLSATEFRDALALQYNRPLLKMPANCDGCGAATSLEHALDCKKGGLVTQCHNEVRDVIGDLASVVFKEVVKEPVVQEANDAEGVPSLIADLSIRGVWQPQTVALFDVRVTDTDAPSHSQRVVSAILSSAEEAKIRSTLKQQLFAEHHSHPLLCQSMESWVEKQAFLSNILLRNLLISGKSQTVRYWDG